MRVRRAIISSILILSVLVSTVALLRFDSKNDELVMQDAQAATYDENGLVKYNPATDTAAAYGTKKNPFTVLEIVPYEGYAEIGYLTGGKEPVDMERLCRIALGTESSDQVSASAASDFIRHLSKKGYVKLLTEAEAEISNAKDAELQKNERKFAAYKFTDFGEKCYVVNANSFLRESIGLKYITDGNTVYNGQYDIESFEFLGWFKEGTNQAFDFSERIFTDVKLYAKWNRVKSDGTEIKEEIEQTVKEEITPAQGYDTGITIEFKAVVPTGLGAGVKVEGLPDKITNVKTDGTVNSVPDEPKLVGDLEDEYILRGWYVDREGTMPYYFGSAIPANYIENGVMTLYTVWAKKEDCKITFDASLPEEVIAGNEVRWSDDEKETGNEVRILTVDSGEKLTDATIPKLTLLGNVDYKVKNYQLDIVTVTPQELNKGGNVGANRVIDPEAKLENLALIEKANIIMISPQSHFYEGKLPNANVIDLAENNANKTYFTFGNEKRTAVDIWKGCVNTALFSFDQNQVPDEGIIDVYGFLYKNDLCWEVILAIFEECVNTEPRAALVYDAECYHMALMHGSDCTDESPKKLLFGEKTKIELDVLTNGRSYSKLSNYNNVYKLYLMMNQMNPKLFDSTFLQKHIYAKMNSQGISTGCYNWSENTGEVSDEVTKWNSATFLLCLLLEEADSDIRNDGGVIKFTGNPWEKWGVTWDVYTLSDNKDDVTGKANEERAIVNGNCFTYESDVVNITELFATNAAIPYQRHVDDVYNFYQRKDTITMSEIVYYLIQISTGESGTAAGKEYEKNVRVLELQPSESYLAPLTWVWNMNTYIDGFKGMAEVTQQSSAEFIGKLEDLNSTYDMLYIGSDISAYEPTRMVFSEDLIGRYNPTSQTYAAGSTVVLAEGRKVTYNKKVKKEVKAGDTVTIPFRQTLTAVETIQIKPGTYTVEVNQIDNNVQICGLVEPDGKKKYDKSVYQQLAQGQVVNVAVLAGDIITTRDNTNLQVPVVKPVEAGSFKSPVDQEYLVNEITTEWLPAGSEVELAEATTLRAMTTLPEGMTVLPYSYVHTGAEVPEFDGASKALLGILGGDADDNNTYYYSGNDITLAKKKDILEFAVAGYPVVVASRLMKWENDTLVVNTDAVDTASNMYALLTELAEGGYAGFFYEGTTDASENFRLYKENLLYSLLETKCELEITDEPVLYSDGKSTAESYINGKAGEIDNKKLEIGFRITDGYGNDNRYYTLNFYIDGNADGRYTEDERLSGKMTIYEIIAGKGREVTQLKQGRNYVMEADLELYVGVIPWKLEVVKSNNPNIRDSEIKCSAILPKDQEKPNIKVLQILPNNPTVYLPSAEEMKKLEEQYNTWSRKDDLSLEDFYIQTREYFLGHINLEDLGISVDEMAWLYDVFDGNIPFNYGDMRTGIYRNTALGFWVYMREVKDFNIVTERISIDDFIRKTAEEKAKSPKDYLEWAQKYDMLVLGFADAYQDISDDDALDTIEAFIASGRQTLFTHDTTSFRNNTDTSSNDYWYWGYNINRTFRNALGMDRYGATLLYPVSIDGKLQTEKALSISQVIERKNDAPYRPGTSQNISNILNNGRWGDNLRYYVQGYSDVFLYRYLNNKITDSLPTTQVSKINKGQLTEYPYRIGDNIPVAETHCQYYQLDLEAEDIVVWYTLESSAAGDAYDSSYHDARNNYYLYSRGNVIYSGVGHSNALTLDELKLFINTFVASYRVPADPPTIDLKNSSASSEDTEYYYIDFDSWNDSVAVGTSIVEKGGKQYQRVQYEVNVAVPLKNQKLTVDYHLASDKANGIPLMENTDKGPKESGHYVSAQALSDEGVPLVTYSAETNQEATELLVGKKYYVDIPLSQMNGKDSLQLIFRACIRYGRMEDQYVYAYRKINFLRRGLYDLD